MWIVICVIAIILLIYLFLICPALRKNPEKELCKELYVAHRGLHDIEAGIPENSLPAFRMAMENGYAVEIDIHVTKDEKVVVFHDDNLKRVCGEDRLIEDLTLEELSKYTLSSTEYKIPQLHELLDICDDKSVLVIELKCMPHNYKKLCENTNRILNRYNVKYIVQSFNPLAMCWYKKNNKKICRGQLATNFFREKSKSILEILCGYLLMNFLSRPDFISYDIKYPNTVSRKIGLLFGADAAGWTIRSQEELDKCKNQNSIYIFENFIPTKKSSSN